MEQLQAYIYPLYIKIFRDLFIFVNILDRVRALNYNTITCVSS